MGKKIRKHRKFNRIDFIDRIPVKPKIKVKFKLRENVIRMGEEDRIVYIYEYDSLNKCQNIVNVSYETFVFGKWVTILRYDSEHGYLHLHLKLSLKDRDEIVSTAGVKKTGSKQAWLHWAIKNLLNNYFIYKTRFYKSLLTKGSGN